MFKRKIVYRGWRLFSLDKKWREILFFFCHYILILSDHNFLFCTILFSQFTHHNETNENHVLFVAL